MNKLNYPNWLVPLDIAKELKEIGFDEPINYYGEMVSKFKIGGSRNFLPKYRFIR